MRLLGKRFPSVSPSEAAGALLLGLAALACFCFPDPFLPLEVRLESFLDKLKKMHKEKADQQEQG